MVKAVPGSLSEGAAERSEAEGVSSDGSTGPMIYTPPIINSEIFELLRSSGYTPSVSHSLDSSLREGAGNGCGGGYQSTGYLLKSRVAGDFPRPYESSGIFTVCHSVYRPETAMFRAVVCSGYFERLTNSQKWSILPA